jgi:hypothetical protein
VRLEVAKIAANGSIRRWAVDTATRSDASRWDDLAARIPASPPPYRAAPGSAVYDVRVDDDKFLVGEHDLSGPLSDLVRAVLVEGDAVLAAAPLAVLQGRSALSTSMRLKGQAGPGSFADLPTPAASCHDRHNPGITAAPALTPPPTAIHDA